MANLNDVNVGNLCEACWWNGHCGFMVNEGPAIVCDFFIDGRENANTAVDKSIDIMKVLDFKSIQELITYIEKGKKVE